MSLSFEPVWFDSLGAKSSCVLVKTPDISILIDPGIAIMQPSFPATEEEKIKWLIEGEKAIKKACEKADVIIISHYHYDHYFSNDFGIYKGKTLLVKSPNEYINDSQRKRAEYFYSGLCRYFGNITLQSILKKAEIREYPDPLKELPIASTRDFGEYNKRREQLFKKGLKWFKNRVNNWNKNPKIPEIEFGDIHVIFADGRQFQFGDTRIRFTKPLFHGIEFSRVGWVISIVIEHGGKKFIHSSDLNGPIIEDYAEWIVRENPDMLILDGPMTYMLGYLLNKINLKRAIRNAVKIVRETDAEVIIYDHHLPRERHFKKHTEKVWEVAEKLDKNVLTAAEFLGKEPKVLEAGR
ncbi:MBL fold metallo-hydrolase [Thermococci archaeon]|uniref:MBL fold metallo-hydrolase n=1 Tax=Palaeococcus sp. (in: euryarchaeotes) TaxID=2820298 RepID=UPI000F2A7819|nr:MBL fold metallo-hydrolase [Palaeococcus sp. (in: euryarchaeotes)]MCD6558364.1 MBL fold metallo-hydrolase [Palaeococcus sp. (in: euryarchaeotes)]RLF78615.1 MAG: MBL fold metallo-hydrolase [Thermococci archaeon]RLF90827.1 MAG: MBL fold metallo-hydrolase [Thermococci archaeon]